MEVYGFKFKNEVEKSIIDALFEDIEVVDANMEIAQKVIQYRQLEHKKIKIPDAIILATAKVIKADLLTDDWDDFQTIDDAVNVVDTEKYG